MTTRWVVLSGGLDSTTALRVALDGPDTVRAVTVDYGQRHVREVQAAAEVAMVYRVDHRVLDLRGLLHGSALLGAAPVPEGHYAAATMAATIVQGRNLLFTAATLAQTDPGDEVWLGVHSGDHAVYPDCRPGFWKLLNAAVHDAYEVSLLTPFVDMTKADIVQMGDRLDVPYAITWSCYQGGDKHCGRCGTCVERAEAFALAKVTDPTLYDDPGYWRRVT